MFVLRGKWLRTVDIKLTLRKLSTDGSEMIAVIATIPLVATSYQLHTSYRLQPTGYELSGVK